MTSHSIEESFVCIDVRVSADAEAGRVAAEVYDAGAIGLEERDGGVTLRIYAPARLAARVRHAAVAAVGAEAVGAVLAVPGANWPETWKHGLGASVISPRLVVRPSFVAFEAGSGQAEVLIDPGQAFGTGAHESTRLALEWIDVLLPELGAGSRLLDVGCGSGVLALAALRRGAARAVACDVDPLAVEAARSNARLNDLEGRIAIFVGSLAALRAGFDLVVANLLRLELLPLLGELAAHTRPGGWLVLSGLLRSESDAVEGGLQAAGLRVEATRERRDTSGEAWRSWLTRR